VFGALWYIYGEYIELDGAPDLVNRSLENAYRLEVEISDHAPSRGPLRMKTSPDPTLKSLDRLVGTWTTEATHPAMLGVVVHGTVVAEWLEGERFLIHRARSDHPDFPDSISVIGHMEQDRAATDTDARPPANESRLKMSYFDSRGVSRIYDVAIDDSSWRIWREAPEFSQRFVGMWSDDNDVIDGHWQLRRDDAHWADDLAITYRRST
jgi:hypothetical protein